MIITAVLERGAEIKLAMPLSAPWSRRKSWPKEAALPHGAFLGGPLLGQQKQILNGAKHSAIERKPEGKPSVPGART